MGAGPEGEVGERVAGSAEVPGAARAGAEAGTPTRGNVLQGTLRSVSREQAERKYSLPEKSVNRNFGDVSPPRFCQ